MNIVVIGLGSMGKRRVRLLKKHDRSLIIYGMDSSLERVGEAREKYGVVAVEDLDEAVSKGVTCAFVCASPLAHERIIKDCLEHGLNVFTELNVVSDGYDEIQELAKKQGKVLFLSSTFLYRPEIMYIKNRIHECGDKYAYFYHVGQFLPDWHPWEKIQDFFVYDKRTNGVREILVRELPWLTETFGDIEDVEVKMSSVSNLGLNYPDCYFMIFSHRDGTKGSLLMDVVARRSTINLEIVSENLYITWDGTPEGVMDYDIEKKEERHIRIYDTYEHNENYSANIVENAYSNEISAFFDQVLRGIKPVYDFAKDQVVLDVMDRIEESLSDE